MGISHSQQKTLSINMQKKPQAGFTILEMAVIVVISGIILAFLGAALVAFLRENEIQKTEARLEKIESFFKFVR